MPLYQYTAKTLESKTARGQRQAADERQLALRLKEEGQFLLRCSEVGGRDGNAYRLKTNELASFCRELGTMLASGITLVRAIDIIMGQNPKPRLKHLYAQIYEGLKGGRSFSETLESQGAAFPKLMIGIFKAGEANGALDQAAKKAALHYEKEYKMQSKIKSALTYPVILLGVSLTVMLLIFTLILPNFFEMFEGIELPAITKAVIFLSNLLVNHWGGVSLALLSLVLVIAILLQFPRVGLGLDRAKLALPKIGGLVSTIYTARFSRTLSTLYSSGLSMLLSLAVAAETVGNRYVANQFDEVIASVRRGGSLSASLKGVKGLQPRLSAVAYIGEESGRLDEMLDSMADGFDFEAERAMERLVILMEPVMIVVLALLVGTIMLSVLLPLFSLYRNIA